VRHGRGPQNGGQRSVRKMLICRRMATKASGFELTDDCEGGPLSIGQEWASTRRLCSQCNRWRRKYPTYLWTPTLQGKALIPRLQPLLISPFLKSRRTNPIRVLIIANRHVHRNRQSGLLDSPAPTCDQESPAGGLSRGVRPRRWNTSRWRTETGIRRMTTTPGEAEVRRANEMDVRIDADAL